MNKYKLRMKTLSGLGNEYVYVYATSNFERYADIHKLKYARDNTKDYQLTDRFNKLQNNWNELKKWLEEIIEDIDKIEYPDSYDKGEKATLKNILRHMQELEDNNGIE